MLVYALTILLSAFLLFQVEPIIAKIILPWFGGSAAVWTTCLLFFQFGLLLGYLYAHGVVKHLRAKAQARLHVFLLALSLLALPIMPANSWRPSGSEDPALRILLLLTVTVGLPYLLLSATSPLLQAWYAGEHPEGRPYRLFALSNTGSMLALLSYPVAVEPLLSTRGQAIGWSAAYVFAAVLCAIVALRRRSSAVFSQLGLPWCARPAAAAVLQANHQAAAGTESRGANIPDGAADAQGHPAGEAQRMATALQVEALLPPQQASSWKLQSLWVALAACASILLLAVTNHLSQNVAAVPLLWVLPLSLYLLSFILCFEGRGWYHRDLFLKLGAVALGSMAYALSPDFANSSLFLLVPLYAAGLFICCMVCHGELERLKPSTQHLTSFYLMVSMGGALGGLFVGLLAPHVFSGYFELPVGLAACGVLMIAALYRDPSGTFYRGRPKPALVALVGLCAGMMVWLAVQVRDQIKESEVMVRNFYGSLRVIDTDEPDARHARRKLMNGTIQHGSQFLEADRRRLPTTYYGPRSGVGIALHQAGERRSVRAGIVGLGAGTIAAYGRPGDHYVFYDINPLTVVLAKAWFTFLKDTAATVDVVVGDARLSLEREAPQGFDVLAVDAFTSDSIPVHLLTREAFLLYFRHLRSGGILAVHISNRYLDLQPVVLGIAKSLDKPAAVIESEKDEDSGVFRATWVLLSDNRELLQRRDVQMALTPWADATALQVWTDDYSNLFRLLQ
jgi:SAM-dependent methyltransferase